MGDSADSDDDRLPLLDAYVEALHAGRTPDPQVLAGRPELQPLAECLDLLDRLAVPAGPPGPSEAVTEFTGSPPASPGPSKTGGPSGEDFGPYRLVRELGRGGMGVVYQARHRELDRDVALKMILGSHLASVEQVRRFQAEARAAARLHHPHVVGIYEAGDVNGQHFIAMQFVGGPSLAGALAAGRFTSDRRAAVACLAAVAQAVHHLHQHQIVHRDLKPSNILLDREGRPYVTDFGLAKLLVETDSRLTATDAILGTPSYMAPEQAAGRAGEVGPLSDVYSLGAILYEMLTGRPPFQAGTPLETLYLVLEGEPTLPHKVRRDIPRPLERICLKCLEKNPADRYPSAAAVADDLERWLDGEAILAQPLSWPRQVLRWARREPALAARLGSLAVGTVVTQLRFTLSTDIPLSLHLTVLGVLALWALASVLFQALLRRERIARKVPYGWAVADTIFIASLLVLVDSQQSPLTVCFPLLVAVSGLWGRGSVVWFTTAVAALGYLAVLGQCLVAGVPMGYLHQQLLYLVVLVVIGYAQAEQVQRVRVLSRYCEQKGP